LQASEYQITGIEEQIDAFNAALTPLDSFVLPGGSHAAARLHHARTVVRQAERYMTEIVFSPLNPAALKYANRLSDLLLFWRAMLTSASGATYSGDLDCTDSAFGRREKSEEARACSTSESLRRDNPGRSIVDRADAIPRTVRS
jgi:cobalamin adenosyltransferase